MACFKILRGDLTWLDSIVPGWDRAGSELVLELLAKHDSRLPDQLSVEFLGHQGEAKLLMRILKLPTLMAFYDHDHKAWTMVVVPQWDIGWHAMSTNGEAQSNRSSKISGKVRRPTKMTQKSDLDRSTSDFVIIIEPKTTIITAMKLTRPANGRPGWSKKRSRHGTNLRCFTSEILYLVSCSRSGIPSTLEPWCYHHRPYLGRTRRAIIARYFLLDQ